MKMAFVSLIAILLSTFVIDIVWLGLMYKRFYAVNIGHLLADSVQLAPAILFYLLYAVALNVFVVVPELRNNHGWSHLFLMGAFFGLAAYGTYDLTNMATLKNWPLIQTVVDMAWGSLLTGTVSVISVYATRLLGFS